MHLDVSKYKFMYDEAFREGLSFLVLSFSTVN